ncbi:MAG: GNAT family N-acetyltransferase [Acidobacteria bacterium]|nr:GNAT family N-acetyltransferase [Acidobacteriota bacterium]
MVIRKINKELQHRYRDLHVNSLAPEIQNSWEWIDALSQVGNHVLSGVTWEDQGVMLAALPTFIKRSSVGSIMMSLPFPDAYGGVVVREGVDIQSAYSIVLKAVVEQAEREQVDAIEIGQPPFREDSTLYLKYLEPDLVIPVSYDFIELGTQPTEKAVSKKRNLIHRHLRKAKKEGLSISISNDSKSLTRLYHEVFYERLTDIGGVVPPLALYESIFNKLEDRGALQIFCVWRQECLIGGCIVLFSTYNANQYERAVVTGALQSGACTLIDYQVISGAIQAGCKYFNWAESPTPGVRQYKKKWGAREGTRHRFVKLCNSDISKYQAIRKCIRDEVWHYFG